MESMTSPSLIYQSIVHDSSLSSHPEHRLFQSAWHAEVFYEAFMPTDRSRESAWGFTTMARDGFPDLTVPYHNTFEETTDLRALQLAEHVDRKDLPIIVSWSGGIDSTVILAALVKNWPKCLLDRVRIKMNRASYFENTWFFDKIIVPTGLKIQHRLDRWQDCFVLTGNCADSLWVQADIIELEVVWPGSSQWSMVHRKDDLIRWISHKSSSNIALEIYDMVIESSRRSNVSLETIEDFYWWWNFNFVYTGQLYKYLAFYKSDCGKVDLDLWHDQHLGWYHNDAYQSWSAWHRSDGTKINGTVRSYKWPAKQYIYDVDANHWYRDYKTKMSSSQNTLLLINPNKSTGWVKAVYSDGTVLI